MRDSKCLWACTECDKIGKAVLELCDSITEKNLYLDLLEIAEKVGEEVGVNGIRCKRDERTGEYVFEGGFDKARLKSEMSRYQSKLEGIKMTLDALGFDTEDDKAKKQILTNLGFYRVRG